MHFFKRYGLPLVLMWMIMFTMTFTYYNENAVGANSILRQFVFFSALFTFGLKDVSYMASKGQSLHGYYLVAVIVVVIAFFSGISREVDFSGRQSLTSVNPNLVAMYCACGFLVLLDSLVNSNGVVSKKLVRQLSILGLASLFVLISLTGSRGGILILAASLVVYFLTWPKMSAKKLAIILPVGVVALMSVWFIASSGLMSERMSNLDQDIRITKLWPAGVEIVRLYPVFGVGLGYVEKVIFDLTRMNIALHNEYLKIATSTGLVGLFLFFLVLKRLFDNALLWRQLSGSGLHLAIWTLVAVFLVKGGGALTSPFVWVIFLMLSGPPTDRLTSPSASLRTLRV